MEIRIELTAEQQEALAQHAVFHVTESPWGKGPFDSPLAQAVRDKTVEMAEAAAEDFLRQHPEILEKVRQHVANAITAALADDQRLGRTVKDSIAKGLSRAIYDEDDYED